MNRSEIFGILMLGISIGMLVSTLYFYDFIQDRSIDGLPFPINEKLYIASEYKNNYEPCFKTIQNNTYNISIGDI